MPKLITLDAWAQREYGGAKPTQQTLQRWARESRISPAPRKHGRTYFVAPDAKYVDPARTGRRLGLVDRIRHATHAQVHAQS